MISFSLKKEPVSWSAARISRGVAYNPKHKEKTEFRNAISSLRVPGISGYCVLEFEFIFKTPKSASRKMRSLMLAGEIYPTSKDCTNCQKFLEDCLKDIVMDDDRYVVKITSSKRYGEESEILIKLYGIQEYKKERGAT
jgi:Holliday junction resolvase RusA-like endonuclease